MPNDSSLGGAQLAFDIQSQSGVMHLLASIRASDLDAREKNELRDLIFAYANGGQDPSLKITIEQKISAAQIEPLPAPEKPSEQKPTPTYSFGTSRPSPHFSAPVSTPASSPDTQAQASAQDTPSVASKSDTAESVPAAPAKNTPKKQSAAEASEAAPVRTSQPAPKADTAAPSPSRSRQESASPVVKPQPEPTPEPEPTASAPASVPTPQQSGEEEEPAQDVQSTPAEAPADMVAPPEAPTPEPAQSASPTPASSTPAPTASASTSDQNLQRIREIKALVNEKVGNPVNLIDINNEVGREYMGALLDAMKKLNTGSSGSSAMQRLETAYAAVEVALEKHAKEESTSPAERPASPEPESPTAPTKEEAPQSDEAPINIPVASPDASPQPTKEPIHEQAPATTPKDTTESNPPAPTSVPESEKSAPAASTEAPDTPTPQATDTSQPVTPVPENVQARPAQEATAKAPVSAVPSPEMAAPQPNAQQNAPAETGAQKRHAIPNGAPAPVPRHSDEEQIESGWGPSTDTLHPDAVQPKNASTKVSSLAQSGEKLRNPNELPLASSIETSSVSGDPLFTKEVDNGLDRLLAEWSLFKKSGLFGTGPKGREHPLYKKIKDLQIPLLLAGRFEGATQEIKQSITDYMNGWRYEQGIIYEQGETFEHYLRRVIRHILDLQKNK